MDYETAIKASGLTPEPRGGTYEFTGTPNVEVGTKSAYSEKELLKIKERSPSDYQEILDKVAS